MMDDAALDALVHRAEKWSPGRLPATRATVRNLIEAVQILRLELARQEQHVESARAIARARREADTATIEALRGEGTPEARALAAHYVSTYCQHGGHEACRLRCKTCAERCRCSCGHPDTGGESGHG